VQTTWYALPGNNELSVEVDPYGRIEEVNEENNRLIIVCDTLNYPDLGISSINYEGELIAGEDIEFIIAVDNNDLAEVVADIEVHLYLDEKMIGHEAINGLEKLEEKTLRFNWHVKPGNHTVTAYINQFGANHLIVKKMSKKLTFLHLSISNGKNH